MSPDEKDQLSQPEPGQGEESEKGFDDQFEAGWKKYEEERDLAIKKGEDAAEGGKKGAAAPPPKGDGKQPYKVLKVGGKEIPVYSKEELASKIAEMYGDDDKMVDLGQLSQDYTRKRQADAAERKKWEEEYGKKAEELNALGKRFNDIWARIEGAGIKVNQDGSVSKGEPAKPDAAAPAAGDIFKEYNLDPEFAQDHEKKLITDVVGLRDTIRKMEGAMNQATQALHFFQVKEVVSEMARIIDDEKKNSPIEDILDDNGKSLTLQEFSTLLTSKARQLNAEGKKINLDALTREVVREISTKQAKAKASVEVSDDMSPEDFAKKYPKLAAKFGKAAGEDAVDKHVDQESKVPPSLDRRQKDVDLKKHPSSEKGPKGLSDQFEDAFKDQDILNAIHGR